jgi:hypothetical protein
VNDQLTLGAVHELAGQARATDRETSKFLDLARVAMDSRIATGEEFTAETIRADVGFDPLSTGSLGALFGEYSRAGKLEFLRYDTPTRAERHRNRIAVWRGRR